MYCSNCGKQVASDNHYCGNCGAQLNITTSSSTVSQNSNDSIYHENKKTAFFKNNKKMLLTGAGIGVIVATVVLASIFLFNTFREKYYFSSEKYDDLKNNPSTSSKSGGKYSTAIITDNFYSGVKVNNLKDAENLIIKDSVSQKDKCPTEIKEIENEFINNYGITAVNLCEMDVGFARELENVFKKIYEEYPSAIGYITNLTLINCDLKNNYIAAFMPIFYFAEGDVASTYSWVIKTQILLNTSYFLNLDRLESSVVSGSDSGHFPPNATIYSPVAHELGHYISFLAMMRNYKEDSILLIDDNNIENLRSIYEDFASGDFSLNMIEEAFENYKRNTNTTMSLDEWRGTISQYALAKDNNGDYIYDETVAESFHDVYLNGDNASDASKYIIDVLKKKLEG